jgi:hypothetical protein
MIQTRSEETGLREFSSAKEAFEFAANDPTVWKISFSLEGERVRLVSNGDGTWIFEPLLGRPLVNAEIDFNEKSAE